MKDATSKRIETAANIAIIVSALLAGAVLVRQLLTPHQEAGGSASAAVQSAARPYARNPELVQGHQIHLAGFDWASRPSTLLLVLSATCHYCQESGLFYNRLTAEAHRAHVTVTALFPQEEKAAAAFLKSLGIAVDVVITAAPASIGVHGTPTILLVDRHGIVTAAWFGKLLPTKEAEVMASLTRRTSE